jgi:hypothetical protein
MNQRGCIRQQAWSRTFTMHSFDPSRFRPQHERHIRNRDCASCQETIRVAARGWYTSMALRGRRFFVHFLHVRLSQRVCPHALRCWPMLIQLASVYSKSPTKLQRSMIIPRQRYPGSLQYSLPSCGRLAQFSEDSWTLTDQHLYSILVPCFAYSRSARQVWPIDTTKSSWHKGWDLVSRPVEFLRRRWFVLVNGMFGDVR